MSRKKGERVLGPYEERAGWRVLEVAADGSRSSSVFDSEAKAQRYIEIAKAELEREDRTTADACDEYEKYLGEKGNRPAGIYCTVRDLRSFFADPIPLQLLSGVRFKKLYDEYRTRPGKRTKEPPAVDTHRNTLKHAKTFLRWCCSEKKWIARSVVEACEDVKGIGKRRPRGKSLGKSGNKLYVKQARQWYTTALALAADGDEGAIAGLMALLLGLRASEIVDRRVQDLDSDEHDGDLLWIPCSKTEAGRRTLEVPEVLRPFLLALAEGKRRDAYLLKQGESKYGNRWVLRAVHRVCKAAGVPEVTAHSMRGLLATITAERGMAGHMIAATLGHADEGRLAMQAYARPGAKAAGINRQGLVVLAGGKSG